MQNKGPNYRRPELKKKRKIFYNLVANLINEGYLPVSFDEMPGSKNEFNNYGFSTIGKKASNPYKSLNKNVSLLLAVSPL